MKPSIIAGIALVIGAGCTEQTREGPEEVTVAARCELSPRVVAELGSVGDDRSIVTRRGIGVEVRRLTGGGWIVVGGPPYLPTPLLYDSEGRLVGPVGREGDGPEEFRMPWTLAIGPNDSIWVSDRVGRIVILDPEGTPVRTITNLDEAPSFIGFTSEGTPYGVGARRSTLTDGFYPLIRVFSTDGRLMSEIGPGNSNPAADSRLVQTATGRSILVSDTEALVGFGPIEGTFTGTDDPVWLSRWSPDGEAVLLMKSDVLAQMTGEFQIMGSHQLRNVAIRAGGDGQIWSLAAIGEYPAGETVNSRFFGLDVDVANAAYDGVITLIDKGEVVAAASFPDAPMGFVSENQFFSMVADPTTGLSTIRIWEFSQSCLRVS